MATAYRTDLGRVGGEVAEALAWLNSPATIAGEIARLEAAQRAQGKLVGGDKQEPLPWR